MQDIAYMHHRMEQHSNIQRVILSQTVNKSAEIWGLSTKVYPGSQPLSLSECPSRVKEILLAKSPWDR